MPQQLLDVGQFKGPVRGVEADGVDRLSWMPGLEVQVCPVERPSLPLQATTCPTATLLADGSRSSG
jgi:hypothetical protein